MNEVSPAHQVDVWLVGCNTVRPTPASNMIKPVFQLRPCPVKRNQSPCCTPAPPRAAVAGSYARRWWPRRRGAQGTPRRARSPGSATRSGPMAQTTAPYGSQTSPSHPKAKKCKRFASNNPKESLLDQGTSEITLVPKGQSDCFRVSSLPLSDVIRLTNSSLSLSCTEITLVGIPFYRFEGAAMAGAPGFGLSRLPCLSSIAVCHRLCRCCRSKEFVIRRGSRVCRFGWAVARLGWEVGRHLKSNNPKPAFQVGKSHLHKATPCQVNRSEPSTEHLPSEQRSATRWTRQRRTANDCRNLRQCYEEHRILTGKPPRPSLILLHPSLTEGFLAFEATAARNLARNDISHVRVLACSYLFPRLSEQTDPGLFRYILAHGLRLNAVFSMLFVRRPFVGRYPQMCQRVCCP